MRLKSIRCSSWPGLAPIALIVWGSGFASSSGECATKRKRTNMSVENTKKQVAERLDAFRKTGEPTELRNAANLIDRMEVTGAAAFEDRQAARTAKLSLWLTLLDTIDSAKDPKFDPDDVPAARITVPPGTPMKPGESIEVATGA